MRDGAFRAEGAACEHVRADSAPFVQELQVV